MQAQLLAGLREDPELAARVERLITVPGVGQVTALTWALEAGDPYRCRSVRRAISYGGPCSAQDESAGKAKRGPIAKQRNAHLQTALVEAAKLAPRWRPELAEVYERERAVGDRSRSTLAVARELVACLPAADKGGTDRQRPAVESVT